jgi:hypothetical protein
MGTRAFGDAQKTRLPGRGPRPHPRPSREAAVPVSSAPLSCNWVVSRERSGAWWLTAERRVGAAGGPRRNRVFCALPKPRAPISWLN